MCSHAWIGNSIRGLRFQLLYLWKLKQFSMSHAVTYTVKVLVSRKRWKTEILLRNNNNNNNKPDGLTLVPWSSGKALCWDVTVTCPLAASYISLAARESGAVAELAASRKEEILCWSWWPIHLWADAIETLGVLTHQLASSCRISVGKFPRVQGKPEKRAFCSKDARCSCNVSMPYRFMPVYQPMTAPTECSYPSLYFP